MTDLWLPVILLALAVFRLTRLVTTDVITEPLRRRVWARWPAEDTIFPDDGTVEQGDDPAYGRTSAGVEVFWSDTDQAWAVVSPTTVGYLVGCDFCVSVWLALAVVSAATVLFGWSAWLGLLVWWAVAGLVSVVVTYT